jgi:hypothetical protein
MVGLTPPPSNGSLIDPGYDYSVDVEFLHEYWSWESIENVAETAFRIRDGDPDPTSNMQLYNDMERIANEKCISRDFIKNGLIKYHISRYGPQ